MLKHRTTPLFIFILTAIISFSNSFSQDKPAFVDEFVGQLDYVEGKLLQLEGAMPQDKMSWTPADGVRTTAQIYLHVAEANYFLGTKMGGKMPENEIDMSIADKDKVAEILKASFENAKTLAAKVTAEDLNKTVKTPFGEMTMRNLMISLLNHSHEHLGQGIAYARMNGVVPPWSKKKDGEG